MTRLIPFIVHHLYIKNLIQFINEKISPVLVLFVGTNVDKRPMEIITEETSVEIFLNGMGKSGGEGNNYIIFYNLILFLSRQDCNNQFIIVYNCGIALKSNYALLKPDALLSYTLI